MGNVGAQEDFFIDKNKSFHPQEQKAIDQDIVIEKNKGVDGISSLYTPLFAQSLQSLLEKPLFNKNNWLTTIWTVLELNNNAYFLDDEPNIDPLLCYRYLRWKQTL